MNEEQQENTTTNLSWLAYDGNESELKIRSQDGHCLFTMKSFNKKCATGLRDIAEIKQGGQYDYEEHMDNSPNNYSQQQDSSQTCDSDSTGQLKVSHDIVSEEFECICIKCNKWFKSERHLESHETIVHKGERPFTCTYCGKVFAHKNALKIHNRIHMKKTAEKTYTSTNTTAEDNSNYHLTNLFCCFICNKDLQFRCDGDMKEHYQMHNQKPFQCTICNESFALKTALESHIQTSCGQKPYMCKFCAKPFKYASKLRSHECTHIDEKPFKCTICNKAFKRKIELKSHHERHSEKNVCQCTICNGYFASRSSLRIHKIVHSEEKPFQCTICDKTFKRKRYLNVHLRVHTGETPYKCMICSKAYKQKSQLNAHVLTHSEKKLFQCTICNKAFYRKNSLRSHRFVHSQERPFKCEVCPKTFKQNCVLRLHMRTHDDNKKKLECSMCKELFDTKSNLLKHIRFFHSGDQYKCNICFKAFVEESGLQRHQQMHIDEKTRN